MQKKNVFKIFFPVLALLGPGMGPGRPDFARFRVLAPNFCTGNRPGPIRGLFSFFVIGRSQKFVNFPSFLARNIQGVWADLRAWTAPQWQWLSSEIVSSFPAP